MASMAASAAVVTVVARSPVLQKSTVGGVSVPALGLAQMKMRGGRVRCSTNEKAVTPVGMGAAASIVSVMSLSNPVLALVDERMSTEGTGLSLGLSNNLLGWILLGVFGLIWSLYTVYTSSLEDDEESGLSL